MQLVAGDDRRIYHGINLARDAIQQVGKSKAGCGILDLNFLTGFDWLDMAWVSLEKKGVAREVINRLRNIYTDSIPVVVVNNVQVRAFDVLDGRYWYELLYGYGTDTDTRYIICENT